MEGRLFALDLVPCDVVLLHRQVAALVEVGGHLLAAFELEAVKILGDQRFGNLIGDFPAVGSAFGFGTQNGRK